MLELDEWDELLVNNFTQIAITEGGSLPLNANEPDDNTLVTLTIDSPRRHPLRSRSVSPSTYRGTHSKPPSLLVTSTEGETRPRLTRLVGLSNDESPAEGDASCTNVGGEPQDNIDIIVHKVSANDSLAGVALRYGVSIAALRRANQLWPSDPIHLRTELIIPRGDTLRVRGRGKPNNRLGTDAVSTSIVEPVPGLSSDFVTSTVVAARSIILSVLPARMSMESLSSKTTTSEDHELDDLQTARARKLSADEGPFFEDGLALTGMVVPLSQHTRPSVPPLSQLPCTPVDNHIQSNTTLVGNPYSSSNSSSSAGSSVRQRRTQLSAIFLPVRTSQLEPEPAMELPVRRPRS